MLEVLFIPDVSFWGWSLEDVIGDQEKNPSYRFQIQTRAGDRYSALDVVYPMLFSLNTLRRQTQLNPG